MAVLIKKLDDAIGCERASMISLCADKKRTAVWLELTNYCNNLLEKSDRVGRAYVGAVLEGNDWKPMKTVPAPADTDRTEIEPNLSVEDVAKFQKKIMEEWNKFDPKTAKDFAKGTTLGKSFTPASFVANALKTGYGALNVKRDAYSGIKLGEWKYDDLLKYADRLAKAAPKKPGTVDKLGFTEFVPDPTYAATEKMGLNADDPHEPFLAKKPRSGAFAYDKFFKDNPAFAAKCKRVVAYTFRGDKRAPEKIKEAGGFWPNATRGEDQTYMDKLATPTEYKKYLSDHLHIPSHVATEDLSGFISTSKSQQIARFWAGKNGTGSSPGFVYVLYVEGGFEIDNDFGTGFAEEEIAFPGGLDWDDVIGYRAVAGSHKKFTGGIFLKPASLKGESPDVCGRLLAALSGKSLGTPLDY